MLFLHLEIDLEEHKENWATMHYEAGNEFVQGQAAYIIELTDLIRTHYSEEDLEDDES